MKVILGLGTCFVSEMKMKTAVMDMTTRSIMESELTGEFRISEPVDGAEALLAMRMLKQKMNIY